ncbi:MAG: tetratricopeptide repeat protein [Flavobacteriales bacterium]|nr:tetratricopeptide repeat protein [Flavobacteriales bacterium]
MRTLRVLITLAVLAMGLDVRAQADQDSLRAIWEDTSRPDSVRAWARFDMIGHVVYSAPPDSALGLARELVAFTRLHKLTIAEANALNLCGIFHNNMGQPDSAEVCYLQSLRAFTERGHKRGMGMMLNNLGIIASDKGDHSLAIEHYTNCLRIGEELGDSSLMARVLGNTGIIYDAQGDYDKAMEYYDRRIVLADAIGDKQCAEEAWICKALGYKARHDLPKAMDCYATALRLAKEINDVTGVYNTLANLGEVAVDAGDHARGLALFDSSLAMAQAHGDRLLVAWVNTAIARSHLLQGHLPMARVHGLRSLEMAREVGNVEVLRDAAEINYKVNKALGDGKGALAMHEFYISLRDSLVNDENKQAIMQQKFQYDYDKKAALLRAEQEKKDAVAAEELRRRNLQRNAFIGGFGLMVLLAGTFFTQRNRIGKEKKRSEELLLNILPAEVAEELKAKGEAEARHIDQVTVLFTDFKGFTAMSEQLSPKELVRDIHECFSAFDHIMAKHGIEKIKTIGDAYMAAGGLPTPNTTHALDVVKAALEIRDFIAEGKARKLAAGLPYFEIRIGIHTGPVVAGIVGVKKFAYDIWGDTVNTASRMESSGEVGEVNISEATYALVKDEPGLTFTSRGKVQAKGKGGMEMYFVASDRA